MTSCRLVKIYRHFEGSQCVHFQGQALREDAAVCFFFWTMKAAESFEKSVYIYVSKRINIPENMKT